MIDINTFASRHIGPRNNDIDLSPLWNMNVPRRRGNFNFNIGFGNRRNRGNINIFRRW